MSVLLFGGDEDCPSVGVYDSPLYAFSPGSEQAVILRLGDAVYVGSTLTSACPTNPVEEVSLAFMAGGGSIRLSPSYTYEIVPSYTHP
jgi:hypothetical protein